MRRIIDRWMLRSIRYLIYHQVFIIMFEVLHNHLGIYYLTISYITVSEKLQFYAFMYLLPIPTTSGIVVGKSLTKIVISEMM